MVQSMTGFGRARLRRPGIEIEVEVRSVNHRFLQIRQKLPELFSSIEAESEVLVRNHLRRGSVSLSMSVDRKFQAPAARIRVDIAKKYLDQMRKLQKDLKLSGEPNIDRLVNLPGVIEVASQSGEASGKETDLALNVVKKALEALDESRRREGLSLAKDLLKRRDHLAKLCAKIEKLSPSLLVEYKDRLKKRVGDLLPGSSAKLKDEDLAREVAVFAARSDITEELIRMRTHLGELTRLLKGNGEAGRQIDFLLQEMNRETNTLGSKSTDASIAHCVVEMKGELEKMREQIQNLE